MRGRLPLPLLTSAFLAAGLVSCGGAGNGNSGTASKPLPSISSLSPFSVTVGSAAATLVVYGSNFESGTGVFWNGVELTSTYVNSGEVTAVVPSSDLSTAATVQITVSNTGTVTGASAPASFLVANPKPVLSAISPQFATAGDSLTLTVTGNYFITGTQILWNGNALSTTTVNSTTLSAQVPSSNLTAAATVSVSASNPGPGGGQGTSLPFLILSGSDRMVGIPLTVNDIVWDSTHGLIYASVPGTTGSPAGSLEVINPITATVTAQMQAGSNPNQLSISSDGSQLWVGEDGTGSIERFALPAFTSDLKFNLPMENPYAMQTALSLQAAPGSANTLAVSLADNYLPTGVMIYDGATPRPATLGSNHPISWITWGADASTLYGGGLSVVAVDSSGLHLVNTLTLPVPGFYLGSSGFQFDPSTGYLDGNGGQSGAGVLNPATGDLEGVFNTSALHYGVFCVVDSAQGLVFFIGETLQQSAADSGYTIQVFDKSTYRLLRTLIVPQLYEGQGEPTHFFRWGNSGLAFTTSSTFPNLTPMLYLVDGKFVNSTANPDVTSGLGVDTLPNPMSISPQSAVAGSNTLTVTITGTDFTPGAQAYWSYHPPATPCAAVETTYVSSTELQATIPACDFLNAGAATITVSNGIDFTLSPTQFQFTIFPAGTNPSVMNLAATSLAWDKVSGLLYAAVGSGDPQYPNSIVAINPTTGTVVKSQLVGTNPSIVRATSDGSYLYIGYQGASSVTRLQLPGLNSPLTWPLGTDASYGSVIANDIEPPPGVPQSVAIAGNDGVVTVFDSGVARLDSLTTSASGNFQSNLQWGSDTSVLYGSGWSISTTQLGDLSIMNVDPSGVSLRENDPGALQNQGQTNAFGANIHYDSGTGFLYVNDGAVVDPTNATLKGVYNSWGLVLPDSSLNTVFILGPTYDPRFPVPAGWEDGFGLSSYNQKTFAFIGSEKLPPIPYSGIEGQPVAFVRCGGACLAFATAPSPNPNSGAAGMLYILNDPGFVTPAP